MSTTNTAWETEEMPKIGDVIELTEDWAYAAHPTQRGHRLNVGDRVVVAAVKGSQVGYECDPSFEVACMDFGKNMQQLCRTSYKIVAEVPASASAAECRCRSLLWGHESGCHYYKPSR